MKAITVKKLITFFACYFLFLISSFAQPVIQWQNTIGGDDDDDLRSLQQTTDGGYILGGGSRSDISGDKTESNFGLDDFWIVKLDSSGNIQWQNTIGGTNNDAVHSLMQTNDMGYILGGESQSNISGDKTENCWGNTDYWVVKLDASGNIQWQNTIGGSSLDLLRSIKQTADGGYILGGFSWSGISGDKTENNWDSTLYSADIWILKLDSTGAIQWQNTIGGDNQDWIYCMEQTADGGYILGGSSQSGISGDKTENTMGYWDYWIVKLDSSGNIQWQNDIGGNDHDVLTSIQQLSDGSYIAGGNSTSTISGDKTENSFGMQDYWVIKIDSTGNVVWQNTIGGSGDDRLTLIQQTIDGGYISGGVSGSDISGDKTENSQGGDDYWVVKIDSAGTIEWQNTIGGDTTDILYSTMQTSDMGLILGGTSMSNISGDKTENCMGIEDYWVIKLSPDISTGIQDFQFSIPNFNIYPNPFVSDISITIPILNIKQASFIIKNILGQTVLTLQENNRSASYRKTIDLSFLSTGMYVLDVIIDGERTVKKIVKD